MLVIIINKIKFFSKHKKTFDKILLSVLTFLLIIYLSFNVFLFYALNISKKYVNKNELYEIVEKIDIVKLFKDKAGNELEQIVNIKEELYDVGMDEKEINQLLNSSDVKKIISEAMITSINDILTKDKIEYRLDAEEIQKILENNLDEFNFEIDFDKQKLYEKVKTEIVDNANELIELLGEKLQNSDTLKRYKNYFYQSLKIFDFIYSPVIYCILIVLIISFAVLLMYIRRSFYKGLKWIGLSFGSVAIILFLINYVVQKMFNSNNEIMYKVIINISIDLKNYLFTSIIISVVLIIVNTIFYIINNKKRKNVGVLNEKK